MIRVTFVILSFEGPDSYSRAGGLGTRVTELSQALVELGFETHLFFVGDPALPGDDVVAGRLHYHRWCQWISRYHPSGVYEGEEGKLADWNRSLPGWLEEHLLKPRLDAGGAVVVCAEEWQTAGSVVALHEIVERHGWEDRVSLLWNANNTFSFDRVNWDALKKAATITTVSRYMKHVMWRYGVDARVIPNGIPTAWLRPMRHRPAAIFSRLLEDRLPLVKVARWDPDKRWHMAVDAIVELKRLGMRPLFLARGGVERHGHEVLERATSRGLRVMSARWTGGVETLAEAIRPALQADMIVLQNHLAPDHSRALFHAADAVLANSGIEPFGLVGLETMAVGGVAMVGCTGEDYATHGDDAIALQTSDPMEVVHQVTRLRAQPAEARRLRRSARRSAARYAWRRVIERAMLPVLSHLDARRALPYARLATFRGRPERLISASSVQTAAAESGPSVLGQERTTRRVPDKVPA